MPSNSSSSSSYKPSLQDEPFSQESLRSLFPIFSHHPSLVYLDSAATTHTLRSVLDAMHTFSSEGYATVHRAIYHLSQQATEQVEEVRAKVARFLGAASPSEIIFTKGGTEAINLVKTCLQERFSKGKEILLTQGEHHANLVPWQMLAKATGATLRFVPLLEDGTVDQNAFCSLLSSKTALVCFAHVFNTTGNINPAAFFTKKAHEVGALVLVDGAQAPSHMPVDLQALGADFYTFSFHKMYGPTGLGVLYGKQEVLESLPPYQGGGDMIERVSLREATWQKPPLRFEAGTPPIVQIIGAGAAIDFLSSYGMKQVERREKALQEYLDQNIQKVPSVSVIGGAQRIGIACFTTPLHPMDLGTLLDTRNIAIRTGRHCADPFHERFSLNASCRASIGIYTTHREIDLFLEALREFVQEA